MGDLANGHDCDAFINAFANDVVKKYRSEFLDLHFGERTRYYVMADDNWAVHLYAAIEDATGEAHFRVESARAFYPTSDDIIETVAEEFDLTEEGVKARLEKAEHE